MKETETVGFDYLDVLVRFPLMFGVVLFLLSFLLLSSRDRNDEDEKKSLLNLRESRDVRERRETFVTLFGLVRNVLVGTRDFEVSSVVLLSTLFGDSVFTLQLRTPKCDHLRTGCLMSLLTLKITKLFWSPFIINLIIF